MYNLWEKKRKPHPYFARVWGPSDSNLSQRWRNRLNSMRIGLSVSPAGRGYDGILFGSLGKAVDV
jgi:hypothetical protein